MRLLAFSDLHGDVEALRSMFRGIEDQDFDRILIAEDITGVDVGGPGVAVKQVEDDFCILKGFEGLGDMLSKPAS